MSRPSPAPLLQRGILSLTLISYRCLRRLLFSFSFRPRNLRYDVPFFLEFDCFGAPFEPPSSSLVSIYLPPFDPLRKGTHLCLAWFDVFLSPIARLTSLSLTICFFLLCRFRCSGGSVWTWVRRSLAWFDVFLSPIARLTSLFLTMCFFLLCRFRCSDGFVWTWVRSCQAFAVSTSTIFRKG